MLTAAGCSSGGGGRSFSPTSGVAQPIMDRSGGYIVDPIEVTVTAGEPGSQVQVTTDGSTPLCGGTSSPTESVAISTTTTIKAVTCLDVYNYSDITEATFTLVAEDIRVLPATAGTPTPIGDAMAIANTGDIIYIEPGTYTEDNGQLTIGKQVILIGAGSGADPASNTIVSYAATTGHPIAITAGGTSEAARLELHNLRVTGSNGTGNDGIGIEINTLDGHMEFNNVTSVGNGGSGIGFNVSGDTQDIVIRNCDLSFNSDHGLRVPSSVGNIDGLLIDNCVFEGNEDNGALFYNLATDVGDTTSIVISNSTFKDNAVGVNSEGDLVFSSVNGDITLSNITIESSGAESGIRLTGKSNGTFGKLPIGDVTLSNVNISGMQQSCGSYPSAALVITRYLGLGGLTMDNVVLGSTAPHGLFLGTINTGSAPDLGNLAFEGTFTDYDIKLGTHGNSSYELTDIDIDATGATFLGAADDADIESRVYHYNDDVLLGLVSWSSP
jgi:hypothetical protein